MCGVVSKNSAFKNNNIVFQKKKHCFPTCALLYSIVLKRNIITAGAYLTVNGTFI